jgi:hypothetical protein
VEIEHRREYEKYGSVDKGGCGREAIGGRNYGLYFLRY